MNYIFVIIFSLITGNVFALDASDVQLIDQYGIVSSKVRLHDDVDWSVDASKMDNDSYDYGHNEFKDLTNWKDLDPNSWFELSDWIKSREFKDSTPEWRTFLRNKRNAEIVGRVIKCIGVCRYYHGLKPIDSHFQTVLREGDEFITEQNSYAWISLIDGTLIRIAPKSSLTLTEVNLSAKKTFFLVRLNYGQINTQARIHGQFEALNRPETDLAFYPLMLKEANREFYSIQEYRQFDEIDKLTYGITENPGHVLQYKALNEKTQQSLNIIKNRVSEIFVYTANASLKLTNSHLNIFYAVNGKTHFKVSKEIKNFKNTNSSIQQFSVGLRGYNNKTLVDTDYEVWYEVDERGVEINQNDSLAQKYTITESFLERIPTIQLAREILFLKHGSEIYAENISKNDLAKFYLYYLWDDETEMTKRSEFLDEYIRRVETTNLAAMGKVFKDIPIEEYDKTFYEKAMEKHYFALRMQYTEAQKVVRELDDKQYYLWLLKNAN